MDPYTMTNKGGNAYGLSKYSPGSLHKSLKLNKFEFLSRTGINGSNDTVSMTGRFISSPDCNEK